MALKVKLGLRERLRFMSLLSYFGRMYRPKHAFPLEISLKLAKFYCCHGHLKIRYFIVRWLLVRRVLTGWIRLSESLKVEFQAVKWMMSRDILWLIDWLSRVYLARQLSQKLQIWTLTINQSSQALGLEASPYPKNIYQSAMIQEIFSIWIDVFVFWQNPIVIRCSHAIDFCYNPSSTVETIIRRSYKALLFLFGLKNHGRSSHWNIFRNRVFLRGGVQGWECRCDREWTGSSLNAELRGFHGRRTVGRGRREGKGSRFAATQYCAIRAELISSGAGPLLSHSDNFFISFSCNVQYKNFLVWWFAYQSRFNVLVCAEEWISFFPSFDWLIDWLFKWLVGSSVDGLIDWLIGWLVDWLVDSALSNVFPLFFNRR